MYRFIYSIDYWHYLRYIYIYIYIHIVLIIGTVCDPVLLGTSCGLTLSGTTLKEFSLLWDVARQICTPLLTSTHEISYPVTSQFICTILLGTAGYGCLL